MEMRLTRLPSSEGGPSCLVSEFSLVCTSLSVAMVFWRDAGSCCCNWDASGDSSRSQTFADDLGKRFPEDTAVRFSYLPVLRALLALKSGEPAKAIELLQIAAPYEFGSPPSAFGAFGALYPIYVRGEAYLAANQGAEAAAEFQKILDHRGIVVNDPIGALARWRLGKALALSGDRSEE